MDVKKVESTEVSQQWPAACKEWGRVKSRGGVFRRLAQADSGWSCNSPNSTCPRQNMLFFPCKTWESSTYLYWLGGLHLRALGRWEENWGKVDTITFTFHISKRKCNSVFFSFFFLSLYESIFPSVPHSFLPNFDGCDVSLVLLRVPWQLLEGFSTVHSASAKEDLPSQSRWLFWGGFL